MTPEIMAKALAEQALAEKSSFVTLGDFEMDSMREEYMDCGFPSLNELGVFKKGTGELVVVQARPSIGKSAFCMQIASYMAHNDPVLVISLEMTLKSLRQRMMAAETGYEMPQVHKLAGDPAVYERAREAIRAWQIYAVDKKNLDIDRICRFVHEFLTKFPARLIVIDYLQYISCAGARSRSEEIGEVVKKLANLTQETGVSILCAAQSSRACVDRGNKGEGKVSYAPQMADLGESGKIEAAADCVISLNRDSFYTGHNPDEADVNVLKLRNGCGRNIKMGWDGARTRFIDRAKEPKKAKSQWE